jgi:hypothetical protein
MLHVFGIITGFILLLLRRGRKYDDHTYEEIGDDLSGVIVEEESSDWFMFSPHPSISHATWRAFIKACRLRRWNYSDYMGEHLGAFSLSLQMLLSLGFIESIRRSTTGWVVDWNFPYTQTAFLERPALQIAAFTRQAMEHISLLNKERSHLIGASIDGRKATLSGLVAILSLMNVSHLKPNMSLNGDVSRIYRRTNGLF